MIKQCFYGYRCEPDLVICACSVTLPLSNNIKLFSWLVSINSLKSGVAEYWQIGPPLSFLFLNIFFQICLIRVNKATTMRSNILCLPLWLKTDLCSDWDYFWAGGCRRRWGNWARRIYWWQLFSHFNKLSNI